MRVLPMFGAWFRKQEGEIARWLRELHARPEIAFEEQWTATFIADRLRAFGLQVEAGIGGTGVVGVLEGSRGHGQKHRMIGLRAELDALPMQEEATVDYPSKVAGRFHGCGHDGHMVTLLATAAYLAEHRDFSGTAAFIFQPAEESLAGAKAMLDDKLLSQFPLDEIYALHNLPGLPSGHIGVVRGGALAAGDFVTVTIRAKGTHGSAPHTGQDAVMAAASFLTTLQQTITRVVDCRESGVISFGRIAGGTAGNVLPECVEMEGTMRTLAPATRDAFIRQIEATARSVEHSYGVRVEVAIASKVPLTLNHDIGIEAVLASAERVVGRERIIQNARPVMASEDFSFLLEEVPGAYFFVGQSGHYCHHPEYVFDPAVIPVGAAMFVDLVISRCNTVPIRKKRKIK